MIVTLTANPSLDRTVVLADPLQVGQVQVARAAREDAGGKGINVSRVVAASAVPTRAVLPLADDDPFAVALQTTALPSSLVPVAGHARANVTITDPAGVTTKINLPGAELTAADAAAVTAAVVSACADARWLVLAGSLPPGVADDFYVDVIDAVRSRWGSGAPRIAVDTSGPALRAVVERARPDLIKPNEHELAELAGVTLDPAVDLVSSVATIARGLVPTRVGAALVTLGGAGAVLITPDAVWAGTPPTIRVQSTVGAGDSSLAGYLIADVSAAEPHERLRSAIRYGAAAATLPGTQAPTPLDLPTGDVPVRALET
ncbi:MULTISPECIES: 1-phosphofructokinase [unclassified Microbacterium]|uniref:1-phosphofructokinase n=1 Tax=unclassified Microbacterium TaxID=2609290 RepID=UPI00214AD919|nr:MULTISPECIES: 1-phosphofructokinase [unclassified Microbacterium]MCR2784602.1 1-phosphofructokinase [Microbacterium sp. zg.B96]MDL5350479.1 1-phosphofructokinase [Microbacterium sp. zg-YB36]WIM14591.1 1-phosphofructokinase [Microbacterium sp. zg-B96]